MITGHDLINEYYEDERLYSTGDSELDYLLEKAFSEGYEYAQREFAKKEKEEESGEENKKKKNIGKKIAVGAGIAAGATLAGVGAYQGIKKAKYLKSLKNVKLDPNTKKYDLTMKENKFDKFGRKIEGGVKGVKEKGKKLVDRMKHGKYTHPGWDSDDPE